MVETTAVVKLQKKIPNLDGAQTYLAFTADHKDTRNKEWSEWTPSLNITMTVKNELAKEFDLNEVYTITIKKQETQL